MTPLRVQATICGAIALPHGALALDALLASQVALRRELPPPRHAADCEPIDIPIELEPGGRFHLASFSISEFDQHEIRWVNRRAPIQEYALLGERKIRRVLITGGSNKSYRLPLEVGHAKGDAVTWYCIGDRDPILELLSSVSRLGKRRGVGLGRVTQWRVEPCDTWPGFPVVRDGKPLRTLPVDWPGLLDPPLAYKTLTYPHWDHTSEVLCACPE